MFSYIWSDLNIFTCDGTSVTELQLHPGVLVIAPSWPRLEVLTGTRVCGWPEHPVLLAVFVPEGWSVQTRNPQDVIAICLRIRGKERPMKWLYRRWKHSLRSSLNFLLPLLKSSFFSDKEPLSKEDGLKVSGCVTSPSCRHLSYWASYNVNTRFGEDSVGKSGLVESETSPAVHSNTAAQTVGHGTGVDGRLAHDRCLQIIKITWEGVLLSWISSREWYSCRHGAFKLYRTKD